MFINRQGEIAYLNGLLARAQAGSAQLGVMTGRRRVGKSELLMHWAEQSGVPAIYWQAVKEPAVRQRARFSARLNDTLLDFAPVYGSWRELWDAAGRVLTRNHRILILDNLPYAVEADDEMLPALHAAWERYFQTSQMTVILCGSHGRIMAGLLSDKSLLQQQVTARMDLAPLPFSDMQEFFPGWDAENRVAAYAISGGVPAYLNWLNPELSLTDNFQQTILHPGSMFLAEPDFLLYDELREPNNYLGIMKAISSGAHTLTEISAWTAIPATSVTFYLGVLQELHLVERRLPVTVQAFGRGRARNGRYFISDAYFQFYMRFLEPFLSSYPFSSGQVADFFRGGLPDFVGESALPELARNWLQTQASAGKVPFTMDDIGSFWNGRVTLDVVGINWTSRDILLGECKWKTDPVDVLEVRALTETKSRWVLQDLPAEGEGWQVHYAFFSRKGFLPAAYNQLQKFGGLAVNLNNLDAALK